MSKKNILIDATHREETRVVVVDGNRIEEYDHESLSRKPIKGNIYLAKVTRVEPSLQAAFVDYGGNRHGFLAFSEIHPDYYRIPVEDREQLLAEEREMDDAEFDDEEDAAFAAPSESSPTPSPDTLDLPPMEAASEDEAAAHESSNSDTTDGDAPLPAASLVEDAPADDMTVEEVGGGTPASAEEPAFDADEQERTSSVELSASDLSVSAYPSEEPPAAQDDEASVTENGENAEPSVPAEGGFDVAPAAAEETTPAPKPESVGGGDIGEDLRRRRRRMQRRYKIQEVIKRRQIILVQVTKEERGNKGAALTTYLSLPGRYCVLMPNTGRGGGISRKITNQSDRKRLKAIVDDLDPPEGMSLILRTAGQERTKAEVRRDYEYLVRLWDEIRERTLTSTAPSLIYEEADVIKRAIRDLYARGVEEVVVDGEDGYKTAKAFMKAMMPSHAKRVRLYEDTNVPLFHRYHVEQQLETIQNPMVQLRSGGSIVINATEALVAIDVNSGRATRERNIEETATKTNLEAAEEIARQLRLRDLAGLIVIDFIDMEENRNNHAVERRLKEAMKDDRARIQIGRISHFGLLEMSRQRLRASLVETSTERCPICAGTGLVRSTESTALQILRAVEEEALKRRAGEITVTVPMRVALHLLNHARKSLSDAEERFALSVVVLGDEHMATPAYKIEVTKQRDPALAAAPLRHDIAAAERRAALIAADAEADAAVEEPEVSDEIEDAESGEADSPGEPQANRGPREGGSEDSEGRRRRRRGRRGGRRRREGDERPPQQHQPERQNQRREISEPGNQAPHSFGGPDPWADPTDPNTWANAIDEGGSAEGEDSEHEGEQPHLADNQQGQSGAPGEEGERRVRRRRRRGRRGGRRFRERHGAVEGNGEAHAGPENNEPGEGVEAGHEREAHEHAPAGENGEAQHDAAPAYHEPAQHEPEPHRSEPAAAPEPPAPAAAEPAPPSEPAKPARRGWWNRLTEG